MGENIAFKSYVFDDIEQKAILSARNIFVTLSDNEGNILYQKKISYSPLSGYDVINFSKITKPGSYYLAAVLNTKSGNYCGNPYIQKIKVVDLNNQQYQDVKVHYSDYFKILNKDDFLISEKFNTVGFKIDLSKSTQGTKPVMLLKNQDDKVISQSKPNDSGYGNISFIPKSNSNYYFNLKQGDTIISKELPSVKYKELQLNVVKNYYKNSINITINHSLQNNSIQGSSIMLKVKGTNFTFDKEFNFNQDEINKGLIFKMDDLPKGFIQVYVEDSSGNTLDEKTIFNSKSITNEIKIDYVDLRDSLELRILTTKDEISPIQKNFSVSVLPIKSTSLKGRKNINFSFYLNPLNHLKNISELYQYDFEDEQNNLDLDFLLLGQKSKIFNIKQNKSLNYVSGFNLNGFINKFNAKGKTEVILQSLGEGLFESTILDNENTFSFQQLTLYKGQEISLLLLNEFGNVIPKTSKIHFSILPVGKTVEIVKQDNYKDSDISNELYDYDLGTLINENNLQINLEEVIVTGSKLKYDKLISGQFYGRKIDSTLFGLGTLESLIQTYGYSWAYIAPGTSRIPGRDGVVLVKNTASGRKLLPTIILNGRQYDIPDAVLQTPIELIEEVYYTSGGLNSGGTFVVFSKEKPTNSIYSQTFILKEGFDPPNEYILPLYNSFDNDLFMNYGQLYWSPSISTNSDSEVKFKFARRGHKSFRIVIEGIDELGEVYYLNTIFSMD